MKKKIKTNSIKKYYQREDNDNKEIKKLKSNDNKIKDDFINIRNLKKLFIKKMYEQAINYYNIDNINLKT